MFPELQVEVVDDEIIISLPLSRYSVTYYKPESSPGLLESVSPTRMIHTSLCG
jgi:hypothetical protein